MHQSSIRNQSTYYTQFAHPWSYPDQAEYAMGVAAAANYSTYFTNAPPEALEVDARWPCRYSSRERIREVVRHRYEGTRSEIHDRIRKLSAAYPQRTTFQLMQLLPGLVPPCQRKEGGKRDQRISLSVPFMVKLALKTWLY